MCGQYIFDTESADILMMLRELHKKYGTEVKTGTVYPTNTAAVLTLNDNRLAPRPASWGFPKWDNKGVVFNARGETALEKKMFRGPLLTHRCVVPSTGFFEWNKSGAGKKDKYLFNMPGSQMLYMAGFWNVFKASGGEQESFVILTTEANESMSDIHDRMPVILGDGELNAWLTDDDFMQYVLERRCVELVREIV